MTSGFHTIASALRTALQRTPLKHLHGRRGASLRSPDADLSWQMIQASPSGMIVVDAQQPNLPVVKVNHAFERTTGYTAAEVIGQNLRFLHRDDHDQPGLATVRQAIADGTSCIATLRNYRKDGTPFWNELRLSPVRDVHGQITHFIGIQNDITARIEAEAALSRSEARYRQMFDNNQAVQLLIDPGSGGIVDANPAAARFYGYTVDQLRAMHIYDLNTLTQEEIDACMKHARSQERTYFEFRHRLASGDVRDVLVFSSPVDTDDGRFLYSIIVDVTSQREAEIRYRALFEQSNDAVFILDMQGQHITANARAADMLGYSLDELVGLSYRDLVVAQQHHESANVLQRLLAHEPVPPYERTFRHKNGNLLPTEVNVEIVWNSDGKPLYIQSIVREISERKQMQLATQGFLEDMKALQNIHLWLSEINDLNALYREMIHLAHEHLGMKRIGLFVLDENATRLLGTYGTDENGCIRNEAYYTETITAGHWTETVRSRSNHTRIWHDDDLYDNGQAIGQGWKIAAALWDGEKAIGYLVCDNYVTGRPPRPYEVELVSILGTTFGHLIERKQTEIRLNQTRAQLQSLFENMRDVVWSIKIPTYAIDYVNPAIETITGYPVQAFLDNPKLWFEIIHPEDRPGYVIKADAKETPGLNWEGRIVRSDGAVRWLFIRNWMVRDTDGQPLRVDGLASDITDLKTAHQNELDLMLEKERVQLLTHFIQDAAHEFRTPLATIGTSAYLMARSDDPDRRQAKANQIQQQLKRITRLVDMLFDLVKLESMTFKQRATMQIADIVAMGCDEMRAIYADGPQIHCDVAPDLPPIQGNSVYLSRAFKELADNACRFTPPDGTVQVRVSATQTGVQLIIIDEGPGISDEALPHIFQTFWRQDEAHTTPGLGLGLALAQKIIDKHGGQISVEKIDQPGACLRIWLPHQSV